MCLDNPFCGVALVNLAANHVELDHNITINPEARQMLSDRIEANAAPDLDTYLMNQGLSHVGVIHLAEKQFLQGLPHLAANVPAASAAPRAMDVAAVTSGIADKVWSPLWG